VGAKGDPEQSGHGMAVRRRSNEMVRKSNSPWEGAVGSRDIPGASLGRTPPPPPPPPPTPPPPHAVGPHRPHPALPTPSRPIGLLPAHAAGRDTQDHLRIGSTAIQSAFEALVRKRRCWI
jgi:hypothetical protein